MNFYNFGNVANEVLCNANNEKLNKSFLIKKKIIPKNENELKLLLIKECYFKLFPNFYQTNKEFVNDFFLDWTTSTKNYPNNSIKIKSNNNLYIFLPSEIINIFHSDLNRSSVEIEPNYNISTILKSFRLPHNPYSNTQFTIDEIKDIISQLILFEEKTPDWKKYPEVYVFLNNFETIIEETKTLNNYFITDYLNNFFTKNGLVFKEYKKQISKTFIENLSIWKFKKYNKLILENYNFYFNLFNNL